MPDLFKDTLRESAPEYGVELNADALCRLANYFVLLDKWNHRIHLVAPVKREEFARRHVLESLLLLRHLPKRAHLTDVGSGGGLPAIPCLIARADLTAKLIESSKKKALFLREALKEAGISKQATVLSERFEDVPQPGSGYVSCRALDRFQESLARIVNWAPHPGTLLLFGGPELERNLTQQQLNYSSELMPNSDQRFLFKVTLE